MSDQPSLRDSLKNGIEILFIALSAFGLAIILAGITTAILDWIPFMVAFPVLWMLTFCILQLKSFFYRSVLLPGGAIVASLILTWLLIGKLGMNYLEKNNTFLFTHVARGAEAIKTQLGFKTTGTGKSSKAKRDLLDGMSYYEDKKLREKVDGLLKDNKFKEASEEIAKWEAQYNEVIKNLEKTKKTEEVLRTSSWSGKKTFPEGVHKIFVAANSETGEILPTPGYTIDWPKNGKFKIRSQGKLFDQDEKIISAEPFSFASSISEPQEFAITVRKS
jgi:hypothetical protein